MKRQRSKAELLRNMKTYAAMKKDTEQGTDFRNKTAYWRMGVEWSAVLWKEEKFSTNEIAKFLQYIMSHNVTELSEERREEIRKMLGSKVDWTLRNTVTRSNKGSRIDRAVNELAYYNTKTSVDYSLLACEYLITQKGYARKRLDRVIGNVHFLDGLDAGMVITMRQDLFDNKGIWIELDGDTPEDPAEYGSRIEANV